MKGKELVNKLLNDGWAIKRINGSHYIMRKDKTTVSIPCHNEDLHKGILENLLKTTGLK